MCITSFLMSHDLSVVGLGTMGSSIARNFAHHGFKVTAFNRSWNRTQVLLHLKEPNITGYKTPEEMFSALKAPRIILLMVTAEFVNNVVDQLKPLFKKNDVIIDGGTRPGRTRSSGRRRSRSRASTSLGWESQAVMRELLTAHQ